MARRKKLTVHFIDFKNIKNNEFLVVNQFQVRRQRIQDRPDIVLFVNGIPLVVIECKSPVAKKKGVVDAKIQLIRYQREISQLFRTNEILIGCNLFCAQYGTIEATSDQYHEWKDLNGEKLPNMAKHPSVKEMLDLGLIEEKDLSNNPPMQEVLIAGLCKKRNLLDIIRNFIVYDYSKEKLKVEKKICRYQQYSAVNRLVNRVLHDDEKRGIIWHWQGSGKSLIMVFAAVKLKREEEALRNPVILIVTDRIKLDNQITGTFENCGFPNPVQVRNRAGLYDLLKTGVGNTIMTTVQKFRKPLRRPLSIAENIIVMTDEAHRTQYGSFGLNLRKALPKASFFAFTGTPLDKRDRNTYRHFSPVGEKYLDRYDMYQSIEDGATVPIKYESRMANLHIVGNSIDNLLKDLFPQKTKEELAEIKRRYATLDTVLSAPRRIDRIALDIVNHYQQKIASNGFNAMIVTANRRTAVKYKEALDRLLDPSWSTIVMTVNNEDPKKWKDEYRRTPAEEDLITGREVFQDPVSDLKILIVCDKLLTGFDAPILQAMYLDQRIKEHTLLQAVARTNRPNKRKNFGFVVDYIGIGKELAEALAIFDQEDLQGFFSVDDIKNELTALKEAHKKAIALFKKIKRDGKPDKVIQQCLEILRPDDVRSHFESVFREFARSMDMLMPDPCVEPFLLDFKFLGMVREGARNLYRDDRFSMENISKKVEELIHAHILDTGMEEILAPVNIAAPDFEEKLNIKGSARAKASHIEYALRESIISKIAEDPRYYESLKDQLESVIETDRKRRKDEAELLKNLVKLKKQEERREEIATEKGLTTDEFAFYGLVAHYKKELFAGDDVKMCSLSREIVEVIKSRIVVDWAEKEDIQKEMRREIKNCLLNKKLPSEHFEVFTREAMELARSRFND